MPAPNGAGVFLMILHRNLIIVTLRLVVNPDHDEWIRRYDYSHYPGI